MGSKVEVYGKRHALCQRVVGTYQNKSTKLVWFERYQKKCFLASGTCTKGGQKYLYKTCIGISVDKFLEFCECLGKPSRQSDVETTSKRRQRMSSNRRRKRVENANGIDVEKSTSFQRLEIDVVSTSGNRRRFDVEKSTSFNVFESTSFQRL